jgi:hypothetical protein
VTQAVDVSKLRAAGASCSSARSVSHRAALALLDHGKVPSRIGRIRLFGE